MFDLEVVAVNDLTDDATLAHLLEFDSVHRKFDGSVEVTDGALIVNGRRVQTSAERNPADLPWADLGVELVLECTGVFRNKDSASAHLEAGAKAVLLSAPAKGNIDQTIVMGVNESDLDPSIHTVVSNGSCTTNCLAPIVKVIDEHFGIERGVDNHPQLYERPTAWTCPTAICRPEQQPCRWYRPALGQQGHRVLPHLAGKLDGISVRVPTPNVSLVDGR